MRVQIVTVPYRYDEPDEGLGQGPAALIDAGLPQRLREGGLELADPVTARLPDEERSAGSIAVNIGHLGAKTAALVSDARQRGDGVLVLAGDDTATVGVVSGLQQAHGAGVRLGIIWIDAHGDFNTPETSFSGILAGMPLAILAGLAGPLWRGSAGLVAPVPTDRMLVIGVRELDEKEQTLLRSTDVKVIPADEGRKQPEQVTEAIERFAGRCDLLFLHIDLDVLDPSLVPSASTPEPNGWSIREAAAVITAVLGTGRVGAVSIASLNPGAGQRGRRSVESALQLISEALPAWQATAMPEPAV
jgi:arginase